MLSNLRRKTIDMIPNTRWINLLSIVALLAIGACTTKTNTGASDDPVASAPSDSAQVQVEQVSQADTATNVAAAPILNAEVVLWTDSLTRHFDASQLELLNRAVTESKAIATASDLAHFYQGMLRDSVQPLIEQKFQEGCRHADYGSFADDDWDWITEVVPFIATRMSCQHTDDGGTECIHQAPISLLPLRAIATRTPQPEDDLYFDVLIAIHTGTEPGSPVEMEVYDGHEDYESHLADDVGTLGDGHRSEVVRKMAQAARARKLFNKALSADLRDLLASMQEARYYHPKDVILKELDDIIATGTTSKLLTSREITALQETQQWVQEKEEGFDCGTSDCDPAESLQEP